MPELIDKILEDLYLIDSDLRREEKQLRKIITELLASKPKTNFDEKFSSKLEQEVLNKIQELESAKQSNKNNFNNLNINFMKKFYYIGGGALALGLLVVAVLNFYPKKSPSFFLGETPINLRSQILRVNAGAFGSFAGSSSGMNAENTDQMLGSAREDVAVGMGGGNSRMMSSASIDAKIAPGIIMPEMVKYSYSYAGDEFELPTTGDVYKKVTQAGAGEELARRFNDDFNLINLNNFQNKVLTNFNLTEEREFGYIINFDLSSNSVSVYQNWSKWPQYGQECQDDACYRSLQLKIEDMPADEEVVAIANQAIADYGIDVSLYGEPRINNQWRQAYDLSEDKENYYIPEVISVVYPLILDGRTISDDYGNFVGINVDVNIRHRKMSGISGLSSSNYQASGYELETDKERIMKFAKQGGLWPNYLPYGSKETEEVSLGTPSFGLISNWKYDSKSGRGEEYYVPAIIFPVVDQTKDVYFNRKTISIPLLKELLDEAEKNNNIPTPLYRGAEEIVPEPAKIEPSAAPVSEIKILE